MITYTNQRYEPDGRLCGGPITNQRTIGNAVTMLVRNDLAWGGCISEITPTKIVTRTSCMGFGISRYDITSYEGSEEEMRPLMLAVAAYHEVRGIKGKDVAEQFANSLSAAGINKPIHVSMMSSLMGNSFVLPVLCAVAGLTPEQAQTFQQETARLIDAEEEAQKAKPYSYRRTRTSITSDIQDTIMAMVIEGGKLEEALEAAV